LLLILFDAYAVFHAIDATAALLHYACRNRVVTPTRLIRFAYIIANAAFIYYAADIDDFFATAFDDMLMPLFRFTLRLYAMPPLCCHY